MVLHGKWRKSKINMAHLVNVVAGGSGEVPLLAQPMTFDLHLEAALDNRISRELGQRTLREFVYLTEVKSVSGSWKTYEMEMKAYVHVLQRYILPKAAPMTKSCLDHKKRLADATNAPS